MGKSEIIHLIESNIEAIRTSEEKASIVIALLENTTPRFNVSRAIYGSSKDFFDSLSAMTDITPHVISGIRGYINGTKMKCVPTNSISVSDAVEINEALEYIYKILDE